MASAVVNARVRAIAPEFVSLTDTQIGYWADSTGPYLSPVVFPTSKYTGQVAAGSPVSYYVEAQALLTAHLLTRMPVTGDLAGLGGGSALLTTSDVTGDLSQSYTIPAGLRLSAGDMDLATTHYGVAFMRLRSSRAAYAAPTVV
jgi:hypothetical protein